MKEQVKIYDTTLRDGSQAEGISFSLDDKMKIARKLDELGIHYLEGGWPGSNPKDASFFIEVRKLKLKNIKISAFCSTRHKSLTAEEDKNLNAVIKVKPDTACIFGKTWDLHVKEALRTTLDENLKMIYDSVKYLKDQGLEVIYDAEHFFDGYNANKEYAMKTLDAASCAGADNITLCDTNGGMLPYELYKIVLAVKEKLKTPIGIHTHNDSGMGAANSIMAVKAGATLVQGTINGYGERCGNADLCIIMPNLQLKEKVLNINIEKLTDSSRYISEVANMVLIDNQPYVGLSAFTHKAGIHVSAIARNAKTYEHIEPETVGNKRRILISELSGKSNVVSKLKELDINLKDEKDIKNILEMIKKQEEKGYQYEGSEASFELLIEKNIGKFKPSFQLEGFRVTIDKDNKGHLSSEASIKIKVNGVLEHTASIGDGPVNALDNALRKALEKFYPQLKDVSLNDFKVRVINASGGTKSKVRVLIESKDEQNEWSTIGVSENIIEASWQALVDSIEYKILKSK